MRHSAVAFCTYGVLLLAARGTEAQIAGGAFTTATVDVGNGLASHPALVIGADGRGFIAYQSAAGVLRAARCTNHACTAYTTVTVDGAADVGAYASVVVGTDGRGLIGYYDATNRDLKVARCADLPCNNPTVTTLDSAGEVGQYTDITRGVDGRGVISYYDATNRDLKVAHCSDLACTAATITTIDSVGDVGEYTSIALNQNGLPIISYFDATNSEVKVAICANPACTSATTAVVGSTSAPHGTSILRRNFGNPLVSFAGAADLTLARCSDHSCSSFSTTTVPTPDADGSLSSLALGRGWVGVASHRGAGGLKVARCDDDACASLRLATLDPVAGALGTSIALGEDGRLLVAYDGGGFLRVAHQAAKADFNRDGSPDIAWRNDVTGENMVWFMTQSSSTGSAPTNPAVLADPGWQIVGTQDFNDDGRTDFLWRHAAAGETVVWFMNGVNLVGGTYTSPSSLPDVRWKVVATDDFNQDGRPDILWQHDVSGQGVLWYMNGTTMTGGTFLSPPSMPDPGWTIAGSGDVNYDGKTDVLWRHATTGDIRIWYMNGAALASQVAPTPPGLADMGWRIAAVADYNGSASPDIVWRHASSGQTVLWLLEGPTLTWGGLTSPSMLPVEWRIVGPR
jgi:hypothetical protein